MIPEYTLFTIKPVALICAIRSLMVGSFLRTLFHGKFKNSVNLINHCSKNYNPARLQFCKNCEPQKIKCKSNYCNPETMSEVATKRISNSAVRSKTKRTWNEWFSILDDAGAKELTHKDIASYIYKNYNLLCLSVTRNSTRVCIKSTIYTGLGYNKFSQLARCISCQITKGIW